MSGPRNGIRWPWPKHSINGMPTGQTTNTFVNDLSEGLPDLSDDVRELSAGFRELSDDVREPLDIRE